MESISLLRSVSIPKLPSNAPSFTIPTMANSRLCFDLRYKAHLSRFSNDSTNIASIRFISSTPNSCNKLLARCGNAHGGETHSNALEDQLKSLLILARPIEKNSLTSTKHEALRLIVDEKYDDAERQMKKLFNGNADVAYEAREAHVQILIRLDKYKEALQFLENVGNFPPSKLWDGRLSLYKAVVHTMLEKNDSGEIWWNKYLETLGNNNQNENYLHINCENHINSEMILEDTKASLKSLLSLKPTKVEENLLLPSNIISINKNKAMKKVMNGEYDAAKWIMIKLCKAITATNPMESFDAQIAYLQILIYLEQYEEALKHLNENQNCFPPSDARPCLYKGIGLTMVGNHEDAKNCWKGFMKTIGIKGLRNLKET